MAQKRGLGRDLESLLGGRSDHAITATSILTETVSSAAALGNLRRLSLDLLHRGQFQPRHDMAEEALEELAESIKTQGVIQPIVVRPVSDKSFEIIAGERRWRAAQLAGLSEIPAIVQEFNDETAMTIALIENIQREDLNPMEKAYALKRLMDECDLIHERLAETVGKSRSTVTNLLRLLNLNSDVKVFVEHGDLEMGHARALLSLTGEKQSQVATQVVDRGLSVRETERLVKQVLTGKMREKISKKPIDPDVKNLQNELSEKLGAKITIQHHPKGKGKVMVHYNSLEELEGILSHIK